MKETVLLLARHGETLENKQNILQGHLPGHLSETGKIQAQELAERLASEPLDVILCSDLTRSLDTAIAVGLQHNLTPQPMSLLREMDWGPYTGKHLKNVPWFNVPAGVETIDALFERALQIVSLIRVSYPGKIVLVVGHGAINRAIIAYLTGKTACEMVELPIPENADYQRFVLSI